MKTVGIARITGNSMKKEDEYYPYPWQVNYFQHQIKWLLEPLHWNLIKIRQWPFSIQDDAMRSAGVSHHAAFEMISLVKAEMEERLESIGKDGDLCWARYYDEHEDERIAKMFNVPFHRVNKRIRRAMEYMAGRRKIVTYSEWIANGWHETPRLQGKTPSGVLGNSSYGNRENTDSS